jgi:hypothetical protein
MAQKHMKDYLMKTTGNCDKIDNNRLSEMAQKHMKDYLMKITGNCDKIDNTSIRTEYYDECSKKRDCFPSADPKPSAPPAEPEPQVEVKSVAVVPL